MNREKLQQVLNTLKMGMQTAAYRHGYRHAVSFDTDEFAEVIPVIEAALAPPLPVADTGTLCHECDGDDYYLAYDALECVYCGTQHSRDKLRSGVSVRIHLRGAKNWVKRVPRSKQTLGLCKFKGCNETVVLREWETEEYASEGVLKLWQTGRVTDRCDNGHVIEYKA